MREELDAKLVQSFPLLYADRHASASSTAMCWGFDCGDGWFDILWELSGRLEPLIVAFMQQHRDLRCSNCACAKSKHSGSATLQPGRCLAIHVDPVSTEPPPHNYWSCGCDKYVPSHPRATQVKEKYGTLRFYMAIGTPEMCDLISAAVTKSATVCEVCGAAGSLRSGGWYRTLCDSCEVKSEGK